MIKIPKIPLITTLHKMLGKRAVHVETIHIDVHFAKLIQHVKRYRPKCYCITPEDYEFAKVEFGVTMSEMEFFELVKQRYLVLKDLGADLQLHVHVAVLPEMLTTARKRKKMYDSNNFFVDQLGIKPTEIVFGWLVDDNELRKIATELNLKVIGEHFHIYDRWLK